MRVMTVNGPFVDGDDDSKLKVELVTAYVAVSIVQSTVGMLS
jgi:hypothetical protein